MYSFWPGLVLVVLFIVWWDDNEVSHTQWDKKKAHSLFWEN